MRANASARRKRMANVLAPLWLHYYRVELYETFPTPAVIAARENYRLIATIAGLLGFRREFAALRDKLARKALDRSAK
jgi:hypothetical protein